MAEPRLIDGNFRLLMLQRNPRATVWLVAFAQSQSLGGSCPREVARQN
jgi:hypothetical protein